MSAPEEEPRITSTDPVEVGAIFNALYITGLLDDVDIYEIVKPDGSKEQLRLGGGLRHLAGYIIQQAYPECAVTLISAGEAT